MVNYRILIAAIAVCFLVGSYAIRAEEGKDSSKAPTVQVIKGDTAKTSLKGKPTLLLKSDTIVTVSGLKYIEITPGTGGIPKAGQVVMVHYTGTFLNGEKFDSSHDRGQPLQYTVGKSGMIKGWDEGLESMKIGGVRKLIIPAKLAWGEKGRAPKIPPNADVIFEVELVGVK